MRGESNNFRGVPVEAETPRGDIMETACCSLNSGVLEGYRGPGHCRGAACLVHVPTGSLTVSGLDGRLALALFVPGTVVGSIVVEGNQWLERWITTSDPDR